jgi:hypothetical protein
MATGLHLLKVTLNANGTLDVADGGSLNQISPSTTQPNLVVWQLTGPALNNARFGELDPAASGFVWIDNPAGIFSNPVRSANGRRLILDDNHTGTATKGQWIYLLRVVVSHGNQPDTYHSTTNGRKTAKDGTRTTNNPVIINHDLRLK